jgi:predicted transcriptional regulator
MKKGLTRAERVLACIWLRGEGTPLTLTEIADELGEDMSAVSATVSLLYQQGKLRRESIKRPNNSGTMYVYSLAHAVGQP